MRYVEIWQPYMLIPLLFTIPFVRAKNQPAMSPASSIPGILTNERIGGHTATELIQSRHSKLMRIGDLPAGRFRTEVESLPLEIQKQVLIRLAEMGVPPIDSSSLHVDRSGMLFYACSPPTPSNAQHSPTPTPIKSN